MSSKSTRTQAEVTELILTIVEQRDALPDVNVFGDSNVSDVAEMNLQLKELRFWESRGIIKEPNSEVGFWLQGKPSFMTDYLF
jgi:hypothetical protein